MPEPSQTVTVRSWYSFPQIDKHQLLMKLALDGATTMRADLETDLRAATSAGFDFLEIWAAKLRAFLTHKSTAELRDLFTQSGISPLSINSIEHVTFRDAQAFESIKQECEELSEIAA